MVMALRVVRCQSKRHSYVSVNRSICVAQDLITSASSFVPPTYHYHQPSSFRPDHDNTCNRFGGAHSRSFSSINSSSNDENTNKKPSNEEKSDRSSQNNRPEPVLLYEGPFASLTLRLKRISLMSAAIGIVGLPALSLFYGAGSVPATGQLAIIATAGATAVGSTALLGYCFSPYVHTMECLSGDYYANEYNETEMNNDEGDTTVAAATAEDGKNNQNLVRVITRDILAREVETIFDPTTDVSPPPNNNSRPFCNFMVMGDKPMYVHADLVHDYKLRVQLLGEEAPQQQEAKNKQKVDDDEFL
eukprot:CAMPEP_0201660614 /NCGR_PEP_ID=MMETSP0494-20130426/3224_1 /ASSEMBLY_ACC=CAM_ASM_000839 /TAXON_ID=420259 /ORGANISM="Thalassiosira gravida, Strain GMp14c1" /LENGTH=302 /DNA_ID=CAMNT_0048138549 /DNA_START=197 /DNA_END=1105 /DNA_ORIENTATION=+